MATRHALRLPVADLLRRPGSKRDDTVEAVLDGLAITPSRVPEGEPVRLDMHLESVNEGIVLTGTVSTTWDGECRRCLRPVRAPLRAELLEVFEEPADRRVSCGGLGIGRVQDQGEQGGEEHRRQGEGPPGQSAVGAARGGRVGPGV